MTHNTRDVEEIVEEKAFVITNSQTNAPIEKVVIVADVLKLIQAERQRREEAVEAERERCRWEGVMVAMNTLAIHTDQIWQSTIQKDSIYKYIDDVQDEAEQKLQALTQPNTLSSMNTDKVTRVEVIDHTKLVEEGGGRAYVFRDDKAKVELSLQDDGRTLKVFIQ